MNNLIRRLIARVRGGDVLIQYLRSCGMEIGNGCRIFSDISTTESYLISLGDNVTVSGGVTFITHDASVAKVMDGVTDLFGRIKIGNNCFIGERATILYGVTLPDNTIVGASSVVTKSVSSPGQIIGGNPAKVIGNIESFCEIYKDQAVSIKGLSPESKYELLKNENIMVKR